MYSTDPIADMLTRIRNALMRRHPQVIIPHSQIKQKIAQILLNHKFILEFKTVKDGHHQNLILILTNEEKPISPINNLKRLSRPGRRLYTNWQQIPKIKNGKGMVIMSTNQGLITGKQAKKANLGGEVLCAID